MKFHTRSHRGRHSCLECKKLPHISQAEQLESKPLTNSCDVMKTNDAAKVMNTSHCHTHIHLPSQHSNYPVSPWGHFPHPPHPPHWSTYPHHGYDYPMHPMHPYPHVPWYRVDEGVPYPYDVYNRSWTRLRHQAAYHDWLKPAIQNHPSPNYICAWPNAFR